MGEWGGRQGWVCRYSTVRYAGVRETNHPSNFQCSVVVSCPSLSPSSFLPSLSFFLSTYLLLSSLSLSFLTTLSFLVSHLSPLIFSPFVFPYFTRIFFSPPPLNSSPRFPPLPWYPKISPPSHCPGADRIIMGDRKQTGLWGINNSSFLSPFHHIIISFYA